MDQDVCHEETVDLSCDQSIRNYIVQLFAEFVVPTQFVRPKVARTTNPEQLHPFS